MTNKKNETTIQVSKDFRDDVMLFKIKSKAKNCEEVLKEALKILKSIKKEDKKNEKSN